MKYMNKTGKHVKVIDSCSIIHSDKDYTGGGYVTTNSVLSELISDAVKFAVDQGIREGFIKIIDPAKEYVERVKSAAEETGDLINLSEADIDVLALSLQMKAELLSDDYAIQNVAKNLGIKYTPTNQEGIKGEIRWENRCPACRRKYPLEKNVCDVCGTHLRRRMLEKQK